MEFHPLSILAFLSLALVASHAALSPQQYWISALPNTPIPESIRDLLVPELGEEKDTAVDVGKGGVHVRTDKGKAGRGTQVDVSGKGGVGVHTRPTGGGADVGVGKGGVNVYTHHKGRPVYVGVTPSPNPFEYLYAASENQLHDDPSVALFFLEKDMYAGNKITAHFPETPAAAATFLPREVAKTVPFSSSKLPQIFNWFSVKPGSPEAETMKNTLKDCEAPAIRGEQKYCATSLESMIDFATSKLGKNVEAISTEVEKETAKVQSYTIQTGVKKISKSPKSVVCHRLNYAYAVFYCHATVATTAYKVPLVGADGTKVNAVAICHTNTAAWNPKHLAFQVLKVNPGTVPICHFIPKDHLVWASK